MRNVLLLSLLFFVSGTWAPAVAQEAGIAPDWEVRRMIEQAAYQVSLLSSVVDQVKADRWPAAAGVSGRESLAAVRTQIAALQQNFAELKEQPERLSVLLEALARLDSILRQLDALRPAVARYQDPGLAIDLDRLLAGPSASREKLSAHAADLARFLEEQIRFLKQDVAQCEQTRRERERSPQPTVSSPRKR